MPDAESIPGFPLSFESPAGAQLREGFRWLRFAAPLEEAYREAWRTQSCGAIRFQLWLVLVLVLAFAAMGHLLVPHGADRIVDLARAAIFVPLVVVALAVAHSGLYDRWFPRVVQVFAPAFGVALVGVEVLTRDLALSFMPGLVLTIIAIYFLVGLLFYAAVRSGLIVLAAYCAAAVWAGLPAPEAVYNSLVLAFANLIGATVCYTLERVNRTNYLESRLLKEAASRDGLTGIHNRRMFDEHVSAIWQQGIRERVPLSLLLVDIDHFKSYNDYYGHQAGDEALRFVATTLARCVRRPLDFTARYGGEEFAVVLYNARRDYVEDVARRIRDALARLALRHPASPVAKQLTVSIGAACVVATPDRSHFGFVQLADEALYEAKEQGRNRFVIMDREYEALSTGSFRKAASRVSGAARIA